jgi:protein-tyrosine phosphatase
VAIILRSVGVPQETVLEDYLLSNKFWESKTELYSCLANCASCFRTPRSEVRALMEVRPEYLEAAFAAIDEKYGSFEGYLYDGLGIDELTLQRLRSALRRKAQGVRLKAKLYDLAVRSKLMRENQFYLLFF